MRKGLSNRPTKQQVEKYNKKQQKIEKKRKKERDLLKTMNDEQYNDRKISIKKRVRMTEARQKLVSAEARLRRKAQNVTKN